MPWRIRSSSPEASRVSMSSFDLVRVRVAPRPVLALESLGEDRSLRIDSDHRALRIFFFQVFGGSRDGPRGSDPSDKVSDLAVGLLPDLRTRGRVMSFPVDEVVVLHGHIGTRNLIGETSGNRIVGLGGFRWHSRGSYDHLRAESAQAANFFDAHFVRDRKDTLVTLYCSNNRQCHTHVSRSRLNDRASRLEQSPPLRVLDHRKRNSVLDAPSRIGRLEFHTDRRGNCGGNMVETDEWSVTDGFQHVSGDLRHFDSPRISTSELRTFLRL